MKLMHSPLFRRSNPLITGLLTLTLAGCMTGDEELNQGSTEQGVMTNTFAVTRIPIPYNPNFGSLSGLTYDSSNGTWWTHDDNRSGNVAYPTIFNFSVVDNSSVQVLSQMPFRDEAGNNVVSSPATTTQTTNSTGLDPEGIVLAADGSFWMIDEENETFLHVSRAGQIISRHFAPGFRGGFSPTPADGAPTRVRGAGFEGIALSPDGNTVYGGHQTALLTFPAGEADVTFIAALHVPTNTWRVYKVGLDPVASYTYPNQVPVVRMGMHDLFFDGYDAQGREQLIYIERDNRRDADARDKRIYRVTLPDYATYDNTPVTKELMVDLVAQGYTREKPEGLTRIGNRYYVVNDNVQTATDPMEFAIFQRLEAPDLVCVGSSSAPAQVGTDLGACTVAVNNSNGKAGSCSGGGDGLASCTFNPSTLSLGVNTVAVVGTAVDTATSSCTSYVNVVDQELPSIAVSASPNTLWPPNKKFHTIALNVAKSDNCSTTAATAQQSCTVTSNQGCVDDDAKWVNGQLQLRAERDGGDHDGRIYTITCTATDGSGNTRSATTTVVVPHNQ